MHPKWQTKDEFPGSISLPYGVKTSHTWHEIGAILRIINDYEVNTFIELGCHVGGLGTIVAGRSHWHRNFRYIGVDKDLSVVDSDVLRKLSIWKMDIFDRVEEIYLNGTGRILIYCDNGDKIREMEEFSEFLKSGDIIMCHDYYGGQKVEGLKGFGKNLKCGCKPEVLKREIQFLFDDPTFEEISPYLLDGTRIMGFVKL